MSNAGFDKIQHFCKMEKIRFFFFRFWFVFIWDDDITEGSSKNRRAGLMEMYSLTVLYVSRVMADIKSLHGLI